MKNLQQIISFFCILAVSNTVMAQESVAIKMHTDAKFVPTLTNYKATVFQIDNNCIIDVSDCVPKTKVEFYSTLQGGKLMQSILLNEQGKTRLIVDVNKMPAFVLNTNEKQSNGENIGSRKVQYFMEKEFIVKDLALNTENHQAKLTWNATINDNENISFEIMKSNDGINYFVLKSINATTKEWNTYSFVDENGTNASYKLKVIKNSIEERYLSNALLSKENSILIYPTTTNNRFTIESKNAQNCNYTICNIVGQKILSGYLQNNQTSLDISSLNNGEYLITVATQDKIISCKKIIKN